MSLTTNFRHALFEMKSFLTDFGMESRGIIWPRTQRISGYWDRISLTLADDNH